MNEIEQYGILATKDPHSLEEAVTSAITSDVWWQPFGSPFMATVPEGVFFCQAMVVYKSIL